MYSADKAIEILKTGNITKIITYITGDPYSANYMKIETLNGGSLVSNYKYYLHRDNQQTIVAITEANGGAVVEKRYFDAWGNLKAAIIGANTTQTLPNAMGWVQNLLIDRSYTGHEHLTSIGLIHMNGRIYDPQLRRFLSPDNYVQDIENTQNYNRFGYVYNNPLLYTDPSGEFGILVAIAVAVIMNGINNVANGIPFWHGMGKTMAMTAISGGLSMGIGAAANAAFSAATTVDKALFQAGLHGIVGGVMSSIEGGSFESGFAAGAISSLVSSGISALGETTQTANGVTKTVANKFGQSSWFKATMITSAGLSGGLSSSIAGGNFWAGARQGVIVAAMNHLRHMGFDKGEPQIDPPGKKKSIAEKVKEKVADVKEKIAEGIEFVEDFTGGVTDFIETYNEMKDANWKNSDKYFHSKANFKATLRGPGGRYAAEKMSNLREITDQRIKGDSKSSSVDDQKANVYGRLKAQNIDCYDFEYNTFSYGDILTKYRPVSLPSKY